MRRRVKRADGPERIFGEWWRRDGEIAAVRDYFQLEDDAGERFWVFRRGDGEHAATGDLTLVPARAVRMTARYVELQATSHFSFLRGASSCEELFGQAALCGIEALAIVDRNSLAGIVRAHEAAKVTGVRLIVGCRLDLADGSTLLVYPTDRPAYARLCRLLSLGKRRAGKGQLRSSTWSDVADYAEGLVAILVPDEADEDLRRPARAVSRDDFGDRAYLALTLRRRPGDPLRLHDLSNLAAQAARCDGRRPTTCCSTSPTAASCRMWSPASAQGCTIDEPGFGASAMPTAI